MLDERNADSVLFKLEQLPKPEPGSSGDMLSQLSKPKPNAPQGGSGLIDIKELMGGAATDLVTPGESDDNLTAETSLASAQSSLVGTAHLSTSQIAADASAVLPTTPARSKAPMVVLVVLAGLALVAAVAAVLVRGI